MFPRPATVRWSSTAALSGARLPARRLARNAVVKPRPSGSGPFFTSSRCSASSASASSHVPKRRVSRYATRLPSSSSRTARSWVAGAYRKPPVIRRCTSSAWPLSSRTTMYFPRRSTDAMRSPLSTPATSCGSSGRVSRASSIRTEAMRFPSTTAASRPRSVSTSGSSGNGVEHDRNARRRRAVDDVRAEDGVRRIVCGRLVTRVDLGERFAFLHLVSTLLPADDSDGVIDRIVLRASSRAEMERGDSDGQRGEALHVAVARGEDLADEGRLRKLPVRIAPLRPHPALVRLEGRPVRDRALCPTASFVSVDAEIGERKQVRARREHEL